METKLLFALDIGTRSVVGLVGEEIGNSLKIIAAERQEHHTRAMLDGQIHDVPEVAVVLNTIRQKLEESCGKLTKVSVAAAGRALCTITACAECDAAGKGLLSPQDEQALELTAIQAAQHQLATSDAVDDPSGYYCVGYSVVNFTLDGTAFKTIVGQRGKTAGVKVIATFLPRQVIDSLQAALEKAGLEMATLTLEPIAAINILIPATMRHLNLALVDVGAGTSDVAITRDGMVVGYGMVPWAGDEITESLSKHFLLDFNVAEKVKRQLNSSKTKKVTFTDILGSVQKASVKDIRAVLAPHVAELAQAIATQIITLNNTAPQAVLLVGGGSLTPMLPEALAEALDIPESRVAVRCPDNVEGIDNIPPFLMAPDGVTPLGILKLAGSKTLNFVNVTLNGQALHLFNLGNLTIANALLAAGINIRTLQGRPGLGITVTINNQTKFLPGTHGKPGCISLNGAPASFTDIIHDRDVITVTNGTDGTSPTPAVKDVITVPDPLTVTLNGRQTVILPTINVNNKPATLDTLLSDRDQVTCHLPTILSEVLAAAKMVIKPQCYTYQINDSERIYTTYPKFKVNGRLAANDTPIASGDTIEIEPGAAPTLKELLGIAASEEEFVDVLFNGAKCSIPTRRYTFTINGNPAGLNDIPSQGSTIEYSCLERANLMIADVLLAANFNPRALPANTTIEILLNGQPAEYTAPVKNGDTIDISRN